jgi:hypothetical protein
MKNDQNKEPLLNQTQQTFDHKSSAFSSMDCTGLSPTGMNRSDQAEAYKDLYDMGAPITPERYDANTRHAKKGRGRSS